MCLNQVKTTIFLEYGVSVLSTRIVSFDLMFKETHWPWYRAQESGFCGLGFESRQRQVNLGVYRARSFLVLRLCTTIDVKLMGPN